MIRRRRAELQETKTGHERWLVSYADFVTLLFGFFVVMYSVSQVSEQKYRALTDSLQAVFPGSTPREIETLLDQYTQQSGGQVSGLTPADTAPQYVDSTVLAAQLHDTLINLVSANLVSITATEEWVQIDLNANILFASGSADPSVEAERIFGEIAELLAPYSNDIEVSGHTDNLPIRTARFHSNWELSAARAASVVRLLSNRGVAPQRLSAVGYGEFRPVADNATEASRAQNRRVVLMVARHQLPRPTVPLLGHQWQAPDERPTPLSPQPPQAEDTARTLQPTRTPEGGLLFRHDP